MKNLFKKTMLFAAAAMAFVSCENDTTDVTTLPGVEVTINATTSESRSAFGEPDGTTYPTLWEGTEEWSTFINTQAKKARNEDIVFSDDKTSAVAKPEYESITEAESYTLRAISPYQSGISTFSGFAFTIPNSQTPTATSCDATAQILVAESEPQADYSSFNIAFKHATAYAKFSFTNLNLGDATVNNITITSEVDLVGKFNFDYANESVEASSATSTITLLTSATEDLWFACAPVDVSGKVLTFTINTINGPLSKEVTMPANSVFKSGVISLFNVNMAGIEFEDSVKYELVTDASELAVGDEIIIAAKTANYAISTTQKSSNRAATTIVKDSNYIVDPGTDVEIITLEAGTSAGTFAFKANAGYLYAASSSGNQLKTKATKDVNGSWTITISNGTTSVVATGSSNRNVMQYNYNNGTPLFACYESASQSAVAIYKLPSTKPVIAAASATAPIVGGEGQTATYTLKNIAPDDIEVVSFDGNITEATKSANGTITYNISANTNKGAKVSNIVLSSPSTGATATISVTQAAPVFTVTPASLTFEATANSTATFKVTSTYAATIEVSDETKWSVSPATVEAGAENVEITVTALTANEGEEAVTGTVTVTRTGSVSEEVSLSQAAASTGDEPIEPIVITYNFKDKSSYPSGFPTSGTNVASAQAFSFGGNTLIINAPTSYYMINPTNDSLRALFFGKTNTTFSDTAYLEIPAKDGYTITNITIHSGSSMAKSVSCNIYSTSGTAMSTAVSPGKDVDVSYDLKSPQTNTPYRFSSTASGKNIQLYSLTVTYTPSN